MTQPVELTPVDPTGPKSTPPEATAVQPDLLDRVPRELVDGLTLHAPLPLLDLVPQDLVDGLTLHDPDGTYTYVSPSYEAFSGHAEQDLVGRTPFDLGLFHPDDVERVVEVQAEALENRESFRLQYRLRRGDDTFLWVESTGRVVSAGPGYHFVMVSRPVGPLDPRSSVGDERQLQTGYAELAARQERFLTTVSHRARTLSTTIVGLTEFLQHLHLGLTSEQRDVLLKRLEVTAAALRDLFGDVTEADRISRGDAVLKRRVVDLHEAAEGVIGDLPADGTGRVTNAVPVGLRSVVDAQRVGRMLRILVANSFEHAGAGAEVTVRCWEWDDGVELVVEDDGPGVPANLRERVFDLFVDLETGSSDPAPDTGLGLFIVSELATLHGGRAWVDERPGGGARFHIRLPAPRNGELVGIGGDRLERSRKTSSRQPGEAALSPESMAFIQRVLSMVRHKVDMEVAYLSIFDERHQHILAVVGKDQVTGIEEGTDVPLADGYGARMVIDKLERVVGDTRSHPQLADLPVPDGGPACWMGVPVRLPEGQVFGALCCASRTPDPELPQTAADQLTRFAAIVGDQLAEEGFIVRTADTTARVADVLTRHGAFFPVFQPIVDLRTRRASGVEALTRFVGDEQRVDVWFADAARAGLLVDLEIGAAGLQLEHLHDLSDDTYLTLNMSPSTLETPEFAALLEPHPMERLVLEITEHAAVENYQRLRRVLQPYRERGLRVALDDVGTGYAGFGHLTQLQPDIVKVDRSLVEVLDKEPERRVAVEALAQMAKHLGADLVAEGVERRATLRATIEVGFTHVQGYLMARPDQVIDLEAVAAVAERELDFDTDEDDR